MILSREWFSAAELAELALPSMPATKANVILMAEREGWQAPAMEDRRWRRRAGRGGGVEYHFTCLPMRAQAKVALMHPVATPAAPEAPRAATKAALQATEMWEWYERQPDRKKVEAQRRLETLQTVEALVRDGTSRVAAKRMVVSLRGVTLATLYNWEALVLGVPRGDWLPYLAPRHAGAAAAVTAECTPEAWEALKADFLRLEKPNFSDCYRRLQALAADAGWAIPGERTLHRRIMALPASVLTLARDGDDALKRLFPSQQRDRSVFHALQAVNADGHLWDVFVKWPDGSVGRPMMTAFQDLYSGKLLSWRVDRSESAHNFRLAFGDLVETWGIPDMVWLDNTRAAANKTMTGGTATRFRYKVKAEEPLGILPTLGVEVHWTLPYSGQSKPIERMFRDFATSVAKHPAFAGAYTGNNPAAKPENYGTSAVPLDRFLQVVSVAMAEHNARAGRTGGVCRGRSFDATFSESYAQAPIRKATPQQRRLWLLAAEAVRVRQDGCLHFHGNRYWSEFTAGLVGHSVTLRFDPDALHEPMQVYRLDGAYLGEAECQEAAGFNSTEAAREYGKRRKTWLRAQKEMLAAERSMSIDDLAAALDRAAPPAPEQPETRVVRPIFATAGNTALRAEPDADEADPDADIVAAMRRQWRETKGRLPLATHADETGD